MTENLEHKTITSGGVQPTGEEGVVEALVSVTGLKDNVDDIIMPGAYEKTLGKRTPKGVWSHDWNTPVSKVREIKELLPGDPNLPKTLSDGSPWPKDAGALYVKAEFNLKTTAGREAYENVVFFGDTCEWSIGYKVPRGQSERGKDGTRYIKSLDLFEYSPVLFGAASEARSLSTAIKGAKAMFSNDEEFKTALLAALEMKDDEGEPSVESGTSEVEPEPTEEVTPEETPVEEEATEPVAEEAPAEETDEPTDEELIALLEDDAAEKSEERTTEAKVALSPVLIEQLEQAQTLIKSILESALQVEAEEKSAVEEIEAKSVEDALNAVVAGSVEEKVADEIASATEKFSAAIDSDDEEGIKSHSIAILDLIDANLEGVSAEQERELKTLAKSIGDAVAAYEEKVAAKPEEKVTEVEVAKNEIVTMTTEELAELLKI